MSKSLSCLLLFATFGWPWHHSSWAEKCEQLGTVGASISASLVGKTPPNEARITLIVSNCFREFVGVVKGYELNPSPGHLQEVQAMTAAIDNNLDEERSMQIAEQPDQPVLTALDLLSQDVDEIAALVPQTLAIAPVCDPKRIAARSARAHGRKAKYFHDSFNKGIQGDERFKSLP